MTFREIFVAGFWVASTVEVAGFTYEAFSNTYEPFGAVGSSGWTTPGLSSAAQAEGLQNVQQNLAKTVGQGAGNWLTNFLSNMPIIGGLAKQVVSGSPIPDSEYKRLNTLKQPPQTIVNQIRRANQSGGPGLVTEANNFRAWALQNGWKSNDVSDFLKLLGVKVY